MSETTNAGAIDLETLRARTFEVERFYYDESALLERGDYLGWLGLLSDDATYSAPQREFADRRANRALDDVGPQIFEEDRASLERRANFLLGGPTPETPRPFRRQLITNVRILSETEDMLEAESKFLLWEVPSSGREAIFVGLRTDRLRRTDQGLRLVRRSVLLDSPFLAKAPMSLF